MRLIIKKLLNLIGGDHFSEKIYLRFFQLKESIQYQFLYPLILNIPGLKTIYFIFSKAFNYEVAMFIAARKDYIYKKNNNTENLFLLRRNIHRIEKGLLMKNRRSIFALDYILDTTILYKKIISLNSQNDQLNWAHDILEKYFSVTGSHPTIDKAKHIFTNIENRASRQVEFTPYSLSNENKDNSFEEFKKLAHKRKSVRFFTNEQLPERSLIDKAITVAGLAPSSCNRQPFMFRVIDDPQLAKKTSNLAGGTTGFADHIPAIIAVIGQMNVSPSIGDRHLMYIDASLASMNLMLALESMNIGSCPLNWPEDKTKDKQMAELLSLQKFERPIMLIAYGYPEKNSMLACSVRKPLEQLRQYN